VQILSELSESEVKLLRNIALNKIDEIPKSPDARSALENVPFLFEPQSIVNSLKEHMLPKVKNEDARETAILLPGRILSYFERPGSSLIRLGIFENFRSSDGHLSKVVDTRNNDNLSNTPGALASDSTRQILHSFYLLARHDVNADGEIDDQPPSPEAIPTSLRDRGVVFTSRFLTVRVSYVFLTALGVELIKKCDRDAENILRAWLSLSSS
jgi:hypothetical protein